MEIYKDLSNPASQEFEKLLNSQLSKIQIEEGKIIEGKINKITEKFVFLFVEGLKSEPVLDVNELKSMGLGEKIKVGETIKVLLEKIEDKNGEVLVSASKAQKIAGWDKLVSKPMKIMNQSWVKLLQNVKVDVSLNISILVLLCFYLDHKLVTNH
jgi:small subunit ribosomal protein S1